MNQAKISAHLTLALLPAVGLYLCWWLLDAIGELVSGIVFAVLCVNYFGSYVILNKLEKKIWFA